MEEQDMPWDLGLLWPFLTTRVPRGCASGVIYDAVAVQLPAEKELARSRGGVARLSIASVRVR
eukprot:8655928-Pyramimonas_sp.AAC.1